MTAHYSPMSRSYRRSFAAFSGGVVAPVAVVAQALIAIAPFGSAAQPSVWVTKAPYRGVGSNILHQVYSLGCGLGVVSKPAYFSAKTGVGGFEDTGRSCSRNSAFNIGYASSTLQPIVPIQVTSSSGTIVVNWTVAFTASEHLAGGHCVSNTSSFSCYEYASVQVNAWCGILDASYGTTGSFLTYAPWPASGSYSNSSWSQSTFSSGSYSNSSSGSPNGTLYFRGMVTWFINYTV